MGPLEVLEKSWITILPTTANAEAYGEAYKKLPRAARRLLDRKAKRALKRYRVKK